ncbi:hypothetical protein F5X68DRAFT_260589 [Plectosphaerella plurivora]|uniref:NTF2 domain-containing protein n=1 Tax=Plectosphaerella plurivora TaxID=936078 RepID=A0A9P9AD03_9PEZI|nr:hypothetical protein F5X68DRAFT_260589 [Plectosphaerella plurivora]
MSLPTPEVQIKQAADTAKIFMDAYYDAINRRRPTASLPAFYISASKAYSAHNPDISVNGLHMTSVADFAKLLEDNYIDDETAARPPTGPAASTPARDAALPQVRYEIEAYDAHVLNPDFNIAAPPGVIENKDKSGAKCSVLTQVTGRVYYGRGRDAPAKTFNETFVLVPNWDTFGRNPPKGMRRWLVMSQNFRTL